MLFHTHNIVVHAQLTAILFDLDEMNSKYGLNSITVFNFNAALFVVVRCHMLTTLVILYFLHKTFLVSKSSRNVAW